MKPFFRCVASGLLLGVFLITSCAAPARQTPSAVAKGELPKILSPIRKGSTYTRSVQTGADTYIMQTGYRVFKSTSGRGPNVELLGAIHIG